ncbi:hypothetical protein AUK22_03850 [bacterium CG2_30_54_10]|nr:MAG: hypothetical protein AUK22_03850 [bacterium CG2_30_54_10]
MDQTRLYVIFAVVLCMIFTLAALHRFSRSQGEPQKTGDPGANASVAKASDPTAFEEPSRPSAQNPFPLTSGIQTVEVTPPPEFCFGTPSPEETDKIFQTISDRIKPVEPEATNEKK